MGSGYEASGVDYSAMDPWKLACQLAARETAHLLGRDRLEELEWSRGESAYIVRLPDGLGFMVVVVEGTGTKSTVADEMYRLTGVVYDDKVAQCNAAMSFNDIITVGGLPHIFGLKVDTGDKHWFTNTERTEALIRGSVRACELAGCTWGGGESATLQGIVTPGRVVLTSTATGFVRKEEDLIRPSRIAAGDVILIAKARGIHANGLTLARAIADNLKETYLTPMDDGRLYGDALLDPTTIYVPILRDLREAKIPVSYAVAGTGHAARKIMRPREEWTFILKEIPKPPEVFRFIQENARNLPAPYEYNGQPMSDEEAYATFNMGIGFVFIVRDEYANAVIASGAKHDIDIIRAGHVEPGPKRVVIQPRGITYDTSTLQIR